MSMIDFAGIFDRAGCFRTFTGYEPVIKTIMQFGETTRRLGLLSLEDEIDSIENTTFIKLLQLVIDGTDPDYIKKTGDDLIRSTLYSLENILTSVKFNLINRESGNFGSLIEHFIKSRDLAEHSDLTRTICRELIEAIRSGEIPGETGDRYRDILDLMKQDIPAGIREEIIGNHIDTILYMNSVYYSIILDGALYVQAGVNPRIVNEVLAAKTHLLKVDYDWD